MLTVFLHDWQIHQDLVKCVKVVHIDHSNYATTANALPEINNRFCAQYFKAMTRAELRNYISENRNDDEKVRAAIAESTSRPGWTKVPANTSPEEEKRIIQEMIANDKL